MKFLQVIASADPGYGGPIEGVNRLGSAFAALGHSQEVLTLDLGHEPFVTGSLWPVHALGRAPLPGRGAPVRLLNFLRGAPRAVAWLKQNADRFDGVIVNGLWNYGTRVARLGLEQASVPAIVFTHGMLGPYDVLHYPLKHRAKTLLWRVNEGVLMQRAAAVAFTCEAERRLAGQAFDLSGMCQEVVGFGTDEPPAADPDQRTAFLAQVPALGDRRYFLYLGRLHEKKGCAILIEGFARIAADWPDIDLVMAGPGDDASRDRFMRLAAQAGIAARIHWPGMVSGGAKWGALYGCEAMTLPSHHENFGLSVVEALACGRPVVISDEVNIYPEVVEGGGGLAGPDTVDGTEASLRAFLRLSAESRAAMGDCGRQLFAERFDMRRTAQRLADLFAAAAQRHTGDIG